MKISQILFALLAYFLLFFGLFFIVGCGEDRNDGFDAAGNLVVPFTLQDSYVFYEAKGRIQIEGILDKPLGFTQFNKVIHFYNTACAVDFTVTKSSVDNLYHLRMQYPSDNLLYDTDCEVIYDIYWINLTSDSEASLDRIGD